MELLPLLSACRLEALQRIDVGLEGDWSPTVRVVWTREAGSQQPERLVREHAAFKPSIELYFADGWIGLHCFRRAGGRNVLDEELLQTVIEQVEKTIACER